MSNRDVRWEQGFNNYVKALEKLDDAARTIKLNYPADDKGNISQDRFLDDIIKEGVIQRFEYTHELAWNVMKDFLAKAGNENIFGSMDATREAFALQLIENGELWMDMIRSRNKTSHTYNEETADEIFRKILDEYLPAFASFRDKMASFIADNPK